MKMNQIKKRLIKLYTKPDKIRQLSKESSSRKKNRHSELSKILMESKDLVISTEFLPNRADQAAQVKNFSKRFTLVTKE